MLYCKICSSLRPFEWYTLNVYHVMGSWSKLHFSRKTQKHVFWALTFNIAYKIHFFFEEKILVALDTHAKKNESTLDHSGGGGVHGKACWLITYKQIDK